jgi:hypothetical protein
MRRDLTFAAAATAIAVVCAVSSAPVVVAAIVGVPVLLLVPGHVWLSVLLPVDRTDAPAPLERGVLTVGLSLIALVVGGLALQVTGLPLDRTGWAGWLAFIVVAGTAAASRRAPSIRMARLQIPQLRTPRPRLPRLRISALRPTRAGVLLALAAAILTGAVATAVIGARTAPQTHFTSLALTATSADSAVLRVTNSQGSARRYVLAVTSSTGVEQDWTLQLNSGGTWSGVVDGHPGTTAHLYDLRPDGTTGDIYRSVAIRTSGAGR